MIEIPLKRPQPVWKWPAAPIPARSPSWRLRSGATRRGCVHCWPVVWMFDAVDDQGATALVPAARGGRVGVLTILLEAGGNPNRLDGRLGRNPARRGWTPLVHAVHTNQTGAVQTLLDFGADPNLPARGGDTPLVMAAGYGRIGLVELLLAHGANPALQPERGGPTPLAAAVMGSVDIDRFTIGKCQTETVKALLAHAPQLRLGDGFWDHMAIRFARWSNCTEVLALLSQG